MARPITEPAVTPGVASTAGVAPTTVNEITVATPGGAGGGVGQAVRRISWGAIFAGTVIAMGLMVLFTTLGIGFGAASIDPLYNEDAPGGLGTGSAIYIVVTQLISLFIGGYVASRLAGVPREQSALIHGASVWALSTLVLAYLAITGAGAAFGAATTVLKNGAQAAISAGQAVLPEDIDLPNPVDIASGVSIDDLPPEVQTALRRQGITRDNIAQEAQEALRSVVSRQEQQNAVQAVQSTAADAITSPGDIPSDVRDLIDRLFGGPDAVLSEEDRVEALAVIERRFGITPQEAEQFLASVEQRAAEAAEQVEQAAAEARQTALEAAEAAADHVRNAAFLLSLASILGLAAALGGGHVGRPDDMVGDRVGDHVEGVRS